MSTSAEIPPALWQKNDGPQLLRVNAAMNCVATLILCLRLIVRRIRRAGYGLDDWLTVLAMVLLWAGFAVPVLFVNKGGLGRPLVVNMAIDPNRLALDMKYIFAGELVYAVQIVTIKLAVLTMYWRIFPTRFMKLGCNILGGASVAWFLAVVLVSIFQCQPISKTFDPFMTTGHCIDNTKFFIGNAVPNILTDILILFLPVYEVMKLHLPRSQRIALASIFLLGAGVVAVSGVRLYYQVTLALQGTSGDLTLSMVNSVLWTVIEPNMAIICASLPVLRPVVTSLLSIPFIQSIGSFLSTGRTRQDRTQRPTKEDNVNTVHTIGGTPLYQKPIRGVKNKSSWVGKNTDKLASFRRLKDDGTNLDIEDGKKSASQDSVTWLYPGGYTAESTATARRAQSAASDEIPLGSVRVQTVVDLQETGRQGGRF